MQNEKSALNVDQQAQIHGAGEGGSGEVRCTYTIRYLNERTGSPLLPDNVKSGYLGRMVAIAAPPILGYTLKVQQMSWVIKCDGEVKEFLYVPD